MAMMWLIELWEEISRWVGTHPWITGGLACACLVGGALVLR